MGVDLPGKWDKEADVVVLGAGAAGLSATVEMTGVGADVVLLEKESICGGSSILAGGAMAFAGTDLQKEKGIKDSVDLFRKDLIKVGERKNVPELVDAYLENQLDTYYWMKDLGIKFFGVFQASGQSVPRSHQASKLYIKILKETAEKRGAEILLETPGKRLIVDAKGRVIGVKAESKGKTISVKAKKAVILATGGFARNTEMLENFVPGMSKTIPMAGPGVTGDGHLMAFKLGAALRDMAYIKGTYGMHINYLVNRKYMILYYLGGIIINKWGRRFVDESIPYKLIGDACLKQPDAVGFEIFDSKIAEEGEKTGSHFYRPSFQKGLLVVADTIEGLAMKIGVPAQALKETIEKYNGDINLYGRDTMFGRTSLVAGTGKLVKIDTPPFYAYEAGVGMPGTYGGILVDKYMHAIDVYGCIIPRLYVAGETTGGFHGAAYMTGTALGKAFIFGRIAGRNAVKEKPWC